MKEMDCREIWFKVWALGEIRYVNARTGAKYTIEAFETCVFIRCNGEAIKTYTISETAKKTKEEAMKKVEEIIDYHEGEIKECNIL